MPIKFARVQGFRAIRATYRVVKKPNAYDFGSAEHRDKREWVSCSLKNQTPVFEFEPVRFKVMAVICA